MCVSLSRFKIYFSSGNFERKIFFSPKCFSANQIAFAIGRVELSFSFFLFFFFLSFFFLSFLFFFLFFFLSFSFFLFSFFSFFFLFLTFFSSFFCRVKGLAFYLSLMVYIKIFLSVFLFSFWCSLL